MPAVQVLAVRRIRLGFGGPVLLVRSADPLRLAPDLRRLITALDSDVTYVRAETYAEVAGQHDDVEVVHPTSYAALRLVERLGVRVLEPCGFATARGA